MNALLDTKEASQILGISPSLLKRWRQDGLGPRFVLLGPRLVRYSVEDIEAYTKTLPRSQSIAEAKS
jgi:predicted DNA-binding transcriptional regulator AlpA